MFKNELNSLDMDRVNKLLGITEDTKTFKKDNLEITRTSEIKEITFDYEVKIIYETKIYKDLDECIKEVDFSTDPNEIYVDEADFRMSFTNKECIRKISLDLKSFDKLEGINCSAIITMFHLKADISLSMFGDLMDNFYKKIPMETQTIFGSKFFDIEKDEQKVIIYYDEKLKEEDII